MRRSTESAARGGRCRRRHKPAHSSRLSARDARSAAPRKAGGTRGATPAKTDARLLWGKRPPCAWLSALGACGGGGGTAFGEGTTVLAGDREGTRDWLAVTLVGGAVPPKGCAGCGATGASQASGMTGAACSPRRSRRQRKAARRWPATSVRIRVRVSVVRVRVKVRVRVRVRVRVSQP